MASDDSGQSSHPRRGPAHAGFAGRGAEGRPQGRAGCRASSARRSTRRRPSSPARPRCSTTSPPASPPTTSGPGPSPGPGAPFTRDEIAAAAVKIADDEGFDALSMRRLAAELDAGTMTLYHYVRTKDELLALVNDAVMGELIVPDGRAPDRLARGDHRDRPPVPRRASAATLDARHPRRSRARDPNGVRHFDQSMQAVMPLDITLAERFDLDQRGRRVRVRLLHGGTQQLRRRRSMRWTAT